MVCTTISQILFTAEAPKNAADSVASISAFEAVLTNSYVFHYEALAVQTQHLIKTLYLIQILLVNAMQDSWVQVAPALLDNLIEQLREQITARDVAIVQQSDDPKVEGEEGTG